MDTQKQRFNSAASEALAHFKVRVKVLEPSAGPDGGLSGSPWPVCHGGVFTGAQWTSFLGCHHDEVGRAVRKLVALCVAIEEKPPGINGIGQPASPDPRSQDLQGAWCPRPPRRRIMSPEVMMRRLLALRDAVALRLSHVGGCGADAEPRDLGLGLAGPVLRAPVVPDVLAP